LDYDPTLLKLSVWGETRIQAVERLATALSEMRILGVQSNQALFVEVCEEEDFRSGHYGTPYLDQKREKLKASHKAKVNALLQTFGSALVNISSTSTAHSHKASDTGEIASSWLQATRRYNVEGLL
jgi:acetyl/propionyl-CoA carboxylase alpha subunit